MRPERRHGQGGPSTLETVLAVRDETQLSLMTNRRVPDGSSITAKRTAGSGVILVERNPTNVSPSSGLPAATAKRAT